tara:strand:+ start:104 stop:661 length:558 start_codon:yes stop_codon:yes gene_type:complete
MAAQGEYLQKHSRIYVHHNPNVFNGPFTWRLSMVGPEADDPADITTIYTILPIDSKVEADGAFNLFFNIDGLADTRTGSQRLGGKVGARALLNYPSLGKRTMYGIKEITGVPPVQSEERGTDVAIYFDINSLPYMPTRRGVFRINTNDYNSRSIDKLTADKPLFANGVGSDNVVVNFDISSLDPV